MFEFCQNRSMFERIHEITRSPTSTLDDFARDSNILKVIEQKFSSVSDYISDHIDQIIENAFNLNNNLNGKDQHKYGLILSSSIEQNIDIFTINHRLGDIMFELLEAKEVDSLTLGIVGNIILSVIRCQNSDANDILASHTNAFKKMLGRINEPYIYESLRSLSLLNNYSTSKLFDDMHIAQILYDNIIQTNCDKTILLLANICNLSNSTSDCVRFLADKEKMTTLLDIALNTTTNVVACNIFKVLFSLYIRYECSDSSTIDSYSSDSEFDESHCQLILEFFDENIQKIFDYIKSPKEFNCNKGTASQLIRRYLSNRDDANVLGFDILGYLFDQVFLNPNNSNVHNSFLYLFMMLSNTGLDLAEFDRKFNVKQRIAEAFHNRQNILASYWCHLHYVAEDYVKSEEPPVSAEDTETDASSVGSDLENDLSDISPENKESTKETDDIEGIESISSKKAMVSDDDLLDADIGDMTPNSEVKSEAKVESKSEEEEMEAPKNMAKISSDECNKSCKTSEMQSVPIPPIYYEQSDSSSSSYSSSDSDEEDGKGVLATPIVPGIPSRGMESKVISFPLVPPPIPEIPKIPVPVEKEKIKRNVFPIDDPTWEAFTQGRYKRMFSIMNTDYGGRLPGDTMDDFNLSSSDDGFRLGFGNDDSDDDAFF